jgi:hypothetical protein
VNSSDGEAGVHQTEIVARGLGNAERLFGPGDGLAEL